MKINKTLTALIAGASLGMGGQAFAAGTAAQTDISNTVTLGYSVSGVDQDDVGSSSTFRVDNKVDMTLASNTAAADTVPGETVTLTYVLETTGNKDQDYVLAMTNNGDANHTPLSVAFYSDSGLTTLLTNNKLTTTVDTPVTFYAAVEITDNASVNNGDVVEMVLSATALDPSDTNGTTLLVQDTSTDKNASQANLSTEYVVFAEAASVSAGVADGNAAQSGVITVQTDRNITTAEFTDPNDANAVPTLAVKIINDVICDSDFTAANTEDYSATGAEAGTCPDAVAANYRPRAIPTSLAQFSYDAENSGAVTANAVLFTETLPTGYSADSLANATLTIDSVAQTLTTVTVTPTAQYEIFIDTSGVTDAISIYLGDVAAASEINITFTAIVE